MRSPRRRRRGKKEEYPAVGARKLVIGELVAVLEGLLGFGDVPLGRGLDGIGAQNRRRLGLGHSLGGPVLLNGFVGLGLLLFPALGRSVALGEGRLASLKRCRAGGDDLRAVGLRDWRGHAHGLRCGGGRFPCARGARLRRRTPRGIAFRTAVGVRGGDGNRHGESERDDGA